MHATHYQQPEAQHQTMRVLLMPCVRVYGNSSSSSSNEISYGVVSFLSYRYYQSYEYYILAEVSLTIGNINVN